MAVAAFVALIHDIVITIGVYALTGFSVSPTSVIGLLTILGYSLYDTVVVFDKVRENTAGLLTTQRSTYSDAANLALNQTLVRSINTSLTALHARSRRSCSSGPACSARARSRTWRSCCSSACCPAPTPRSSSRPRCSRTSRSGSRSTGTWPSRCSRRLAGGRAAQRAGGGHGQRDGRRQRPRPPAAAVPRRGAAGRGRTMTRRHGRRPPSDGAGRRRGGPGRRGPLGGRRAPAGRQAAASHRQRAAPSRRARRRGGSRPCRTSRP